MVDSSAGSYRKDRITGISNDPRIRRKAPGRPRGAGIPGKSDSLLTQISVVESDDDARAVHDDSGFALEPAPNLEESLADIDIGSGRRRPQSSARGLRTCRRRPL